MPGAGEIRAGRAFVELAARTQGLEAGLDRAKDRMRKFASAVAGIGAGIAGVGTAITAPLLVAVLAFTSYSDQIEKAAGRAGIAIQSFAELGYAAEQSGASIEELDNAIGRMQANIVDAAEGTGDAVSAFRRLGLSAAELKSLSPEDQFLAIAEAVGRIEDPTERSAIAMDVFGKAGRKLIPLLNSGPAGLRALRNEAANMRLGEAAIAGVRLGDAIGKARRSFTGLQTQIGAALEPLLTQIAEGIAAIIRSVTNFIAANRGLVVIAAQVGAAFTATGAALVGFAGTVYAASFAVGALAKVVAGATLALKGMAAAIALLSNPLLLVATSAAALSVAFLAMDKNVRQTVANLGGQLKSLVPIAQQTVQGLSAAFAAGDLALAGRVAWLGLKAAFTEGKAAIIGVWAPLRAELATITQQAGIGAVEILTTAWSGLQSYWADILAGMKYAWAAMTDSIVGVWQRAQLALEQGFLRILGFFDSSLDVQAAQEQAARNADLGGKQAERDQQRKQTNEQIATQQRDTQRKIAADLQTRLDAIKAERDAVSDNALGGANDAIAAAKREAEEARRQLQAAIKSAQAAAADAAARDAAAAKALGDRNNAGAGAATAKYDTRFTFGASAIQSLQSGIAGVQNKAIAIAQRTAKAAEDTAKSTEEIAAAVRDGGLTFA